VLKGETMNYQVRQGDVFIMAVQTIKGTKQPKDNNKTVLAYGEVTGHSHAIADKSELYADETRKFLEVCLAQGAALKHEEHSTITLPKGTYEVRIQKQWDYMKQLSQQVRD
jgi:hypothetical protein